MIILLLSAITLLIGMHLKILQRQYNANPRNINLTGYRGKL